MNKFLLTAAIILPTLLASCKTPREATSAQHNSTTRLTTADNSIATPPTAFTKRFQALTSTYGTWTDVKMPVTLSLTKPARMSLSGQATIVKGKSLNISLRLLGFEVAALSVTNDSLYAYEKRGKRYVAESIPKLLHGFPATVANLQDLIMGRPFIPGTNTLSGADSDMFEFAEINDNTIPNAWIMTSSAASGNITCSWICQGNEKPAIKAMMIEAGDKNSREGSIIYSDLVSSPAGPLASDVIIETKTGKNSLGAEIEWNASKARWNTGTVPEIKIPRGYTRIPVSTLVKMLGNL